MTSNVSRRDSLDPHFGANGIAGAPVRDGGRKARVGQDPGQDADHWPGQPIPSMKVDRDLPGNLTPAQRARVIRVGSRAVINLDSGPNGTAYRILGVDRTHPRYTVVYLWNSGDVGHISHEYLHDTLAAAQVRLARVVAKNPYDTGD